MHFLSELRRCSRMYQTPLTLWLIGGTITARLWRWYILVQRGSCGTPVLHGSEIKVRQTSILVRHFPPSSTPRFQGKAGVKGAPRSRNGRRAGGGETHRGAQR